MATTFYFPSLSEEPSISPDPDAAWEASILLTRLKLVVATTDSLMTTVPYLDLDETSQDILFRQYISDPINAQTLAASAITFIMRSLEDNSLNNLRNTLGIRVLSGDGTVVRGTLFAVTRDNFECTVGTLTNKALTGTSTEVVAEAGDVIVVEVGMAGDPGVGGTHGGSISIGDDSDTDCAADNVSTDPNNPWLRFETLDITFQAGGEPPPAAASPVNPRTSLTLTGAGR